MTEAQKLIERMGQVTALVIGDVMVDSYLWGRVDRISPEAPVPVVRVDERSERLGGAANVALNLKALGATPIVATVCGDDRNAEQLEELFVARNLSTAGIIRSKERRTTVKTRVISGHQHIVRVDEESDRPLNDVLANELIEKVRGLLAVGNIQVVIFEDYNKGVLTPHVITSVIELAKKSGVPTAVDPKKENFFAYRDVDLFKPNLKELREGFNIELKGDDQAGLRVAVQQLRERMNNRIALITLSQHGVYVHDKDSQHFIPSHSRSIADVSGAGDTVIAVAACCLALDAPLSTLAQLANLAGGLVCEHVGVVPIEKEVLMKEAALLSNTAA